MYLVYVLYKCIIYAMFAVMYAVIHYTIFRATRIIHHVTVPNLNNAC